MKKPVLVIMAAGMGSRYGGLKQMDPVDEEGHLIIDYSLYDAMQAGFEDVIFIIKRENEEMFREAIGDRISRLMNVHYVFQELEDVPEGITVPEGRVKPWGTGHAVLSSIYTVNDAPFAVINADDYYGKEAFRLIYEYLLRHNNDQKYHYAMVGYELGKTVTENGSVARGVCETDADGFLTRITERTQIELHDGGIAYTEDGGQSWTQLPEDTIVSMNLWGFTASMMDELQERFRGFLEKNLPVNPLKCEYFLPFVVEDLLKEGKADVKVLRTSDHWYGVTYIEDKPHVVASLRALRETGAYPEGFGMA
ncbi:MAG: nucleotidyltransferase [Eubacterium sp.]|nr:nucleotidyltransferase [Eubacterium sp.]